MVRALILIAFFVPVAAVAQGKLEAVREAVDRPKAANPSRAGADDSAPSTPADEPSSEEDTAFFNELFFYTVLYPWSAPYSLIDPGLKVDGRFTRYPYSAPDTGHILLDREAPPGGVPGFHHRTDTNWYAVRASVEVGDDFDGLTRTGVRLFLDTDTRFGLKMNWDYFSERLACGCRDDLALADLTATYRFVQHEWFQMHTGLGGRILLDHGSDRGGINFLYGFDAFPAEPVHLFGSFEAGTLGSAGLIRLRGGVGVNWTHAELFAGYDFLRIGGVDLQGPFVGLRLWF